jgi:hypothetical protein
MNVETVSKRRDVTINTWSSRSPAITAAAEVSVSKIGALQRWLQ